MKFLNRRTWKADFLKNQAEQRRKPVLSRTCDSRNGTQVRLGIELKAEFFLNPAARQLYPIWDLDRDSP